MSITNGGGSGGTSPIPASTPINKVNVKVNDQLIKQADTINFKGQGLTAVANGNQVDVSFPNIPAQTDLGQAITHVALDGNTLTFTHGDGAKHSIQLQNQNALKTEIDSVEKQMKANGVDVDAIKKQIGDLNHKIDSIPNIYSFRGTEGPDAYPTDPRSAYFVDLHDSPFELLESMPKPTNGALKDGTVFFLNNENTQYRATLNANDGESIGNQKNLIIEPQQFVLLVKQGNNWVQEAIGYIPSSLTDLIHRVAADPSVANGLHTDAQILAMINNWLANPTTQQKIIDLINKHSGGGHPQPSSVTVHYGVGDTFPTDFTGETGHVAPHQPLIINHLDQDPKKVWFAVPVAQKSKIGGVSANGGLAAQWQSKDINVNGEDWTLFLSPTPLADETLNLTIQWRL